MALSSPSTKIGIFAATILYTAAGFGVLTTPVAAEARGEGAYYRAELTQPAAERTVIAAGIAWTCNGSSCVAGKASSRPVRVCRELQREVGDITGFATLGEELEADKLAKCNR